MPGLDAPVHPRPAPHHHQRQAADELRHVYLHEAKGLRDDCPTDPDLSTQAESERRAREAACRSSGHRPDRRLVGLALRARGWHVTGTGTPTRPGRGGPREGRPRRGRRRPRGRPGLRRRPRLTAAGLVGASRLLADPRRRPDARGDRRERGEGDGGRGGRTTPASSAATRWPGPSRPASRAPTPTCSSGATWVLTPTAETDLGAFSRVRAMAASLGADVVALVPEEPRPPGGGRLPRPHLVAATLMNAAASRRRRGRRAAAALRPAGSGT